MTIYIWVDAQLSPAIATWINANFTALSATAVRDWGLREAEVEQALVAV